MFVCCLNMTVPCRNFTTISSRVCPTHILATMVHCFYSISLQQGHTYSLIYYIYSIVTQISFWYAHQRVYTAHVVLLYVVHTVHYFIKQLETTMLFTH